MTDEKSKYSIPSWASKPPAGSHLDVKKDESVIQKLLIDEKGHYYFGRNPNLCDFTIEHASSSRVHAVLLYHSVMMKFAMVDLQSSHGTFVRDVRIASLQPVFLEYNETFRFGASTRAYIIRAKLDTSAPANVDELPENQEDVDNLTNYNTMQNKRVAMIPCTVEECRRKKRPRNTVVFLEEEEIINPEDVDPTVGRFRNLVQTAVISNKRGKRVTQPADVVPRKKVILPARDADETPLFCSSVLGGMAISAAPSLDTYNLNTGSLLVPQQVSRESDSSKKKYAKEAWPGRKPIC